MRERKAVWRERQCDEQKPASCYNVHSISDVDPECLSRILIDIPDRSVNN